MRRPAGLLVLVSLLAVCVTVAGAVPVGVDVVEPDGVAPGAEATITYEITNTGEEPTAALGLEFTPPAEATVTSIEAERGVVTEAQHSVFWIERIDAGDTVTTTVVLQVDDGIEAGEYAYEARIETSDSSTVDSGTLVVTTGEDESSEESGDEDAPPDSPADAGLLDGLPVTAKGLVVGGVVVLALVYLGYEALASTIGGGGRSSATPPPREPGDHRRRSEGSGDRGAAQSHRGGGSGPQESDRRPSTGGTDPRRGPPEDGGGRSGSESRSRRRDDRSR